jgi:hypothetical protein
MKGRKQTGVVKKYGVEEDISAYERGGTRMLQKTA